jgi:hypothetical protein
MPHHARLLVLLTARSLCGSRHAVSAVAARLRCSGGRRCWWRVRGAAGSRRVRCTAGLRCCLVGWWGTSDASCLRRRLAVAGRGGLVWWLLRPLHCWLRRLLQQLLLGAHLGHRRLQALRLLLRLGDSCSGWPSMLCSRSGGSLPLLPVNPQQRPQVRGLRCDCAGARAARPSCWQHLPAMPVLAAAHGASTSCCRGRHGLPRVRRHNSRGLQRQLRHGLDAHAPLPCARRPGWLRATAALDAGCGWWCAAAGAAGPARPLLLMRHRAVSVLRQLTRHRTRHQRLAAAPQQLACAAAGGAAAAAAGRVTTASSRLRLVLAAVHAGAVLARMTAGGGRGAGPTVAPAAAAGLQEAQGCARRVTPGAA